MPNESALSTFIQPLPIPHPLTDIQLFAARFFPDAFQQELYDYMEIDKPERFDRMALKRKAEYLAGRILVKRGLAEWGLSGFQLKNREDRSPIWPEAISGSITHSKHMAVVALAECSHTYFLGIDCEEWLTEKRAEQVQRMIASEAEMKILTDSGLNSGEALTYLFSAKESLYKAVYKDVKRYFGFDAVRLEQWDKEQQTLTMVLTQTLSERFSEGLAINVRCVPMAHYLLSIVVLEK